MSTETEEFFVCLFIWFFFDRKEPTQVCRKLFVISKSLAHQACQIFHHKSLSVLPFAMHSSSKEYQRQNLQRIQRDLGI